MNVIRTIHALKLAGVALVLPLLLTGCGPEKKKNTFSGSSEARKVDKYKAQDTELVTHSDKIPVYSAPVDARRAMRRAPDDIVDNGNGSETHYYNADTSPTSEKLRLQYSGGRLVGKEILPPDATTASGPGTRYTIPKGDAANYVDMKEYNPKASTRSASTRATSNNPSDNANAAFNNDFNAKLNVRNDR